MPSPTGRRSEEHEKESLAQLVDGRELFLSRTLPAWTQESTAPLVRGSQGAGVQTGFSGVHMVVYSKNPEVDRASN